MVPAADFENENKTKTFTMANISPQVDNNNNNNHYYYYYYHYYRRILHLIKDFGQNLNLILDTY